MKYSLLAKEETGSDIPDPTADFIRPLRSFQISKRTAVIIVTVLIATNVFTFAITRQIYHMTDTCIPWDGPLGHRLSVPLHDTVRDDILLPDPSVPRHIYRSPPSPEVDAAWNRLSHDGVIAVSEDEVRQAGKDPDILVKIPEDWGVGSNMYTGILDGIHQVHCLNFLRKGLVTNYEYYWGSRFNFTPPIFFEAHLNHCLDSLLQDLMCYADQHVTFFNWVEDHEKPEPDFAVHRTCRNYDVLRKWFEDKLIPDWRAKTDALRRSPEQKARPQFVGWPEYVKRKNAGYYKDTDWLLGTLDGELPPTCTEKPPPPSH